MPQGVSGVVAATEIAAALACGHEMYSLRPKLQMVNAKAPAKSTLIPSVILVCRTASYCSRSIESNAAQTDGASRPRLRLNLQCRIVQATDPVNLIRE
jgi:hypothetical protein